jgi:hypothetical protein
VQKQIARATLRCSANLKTRSTDQKKLRSGYYPRAGKITNAVIFPVFTCAPVATPNGVVSLVEKWTTLQD